MANDTIARALAIAALENGGGEGGTSNYNELENLPKINGTTLVGNKTAEDLGIDGSSISMADSGWFPNESVKEAIEETFDSIQAGSGVTVDKDYNAHTVTISAQGGGGSYTFTDGLTETDGTVKSIFGTSIRFRDSSSRPNDIVVSSNSRNIILKSDAIADSSLYVTGSKGVIDIETASLASNRNIIQGTDAIVLGEKNEVYGKKQLTLGNGNLNRTESSIVCGNYGKNEFAEYLFSVGNGTSTTARHNAFSVLSNNSIEIGDTELTEEQLQALLAGGSGGAPVHCIYIDPTASSHSTLSEDSQAQFNAFLADYRDGKQPVVYIKIPSFPESYCPVTYTMNTNGVNGMVYFEFTEVFSHHMMTFNFENWTVEAAYAANIDYLAVAAYGATGRIEIPAPSAEVSGKVLGVNASGNLEYTESGRKVLPITGWVETEDGYTRKENLEDGTFELNYGKVYYKEHGGHANAGDDRMFGSKAIFLENEQFNNTIRHIDLSETDYVGSADYRFTQELNQLEVLKLPETWRYCGTAMCFNNRRLEEIEFPYNDYDRLELYGNSFCWCTNLKKVTFHTNYIYLSGCFCFCPSLTDIYYPAGYTDWQAIVAEEDWNIGCGEITLHCTDGDHIIPANPAE